MRVLFILIPLFLSSVSSADKIYVAPVQGTNVSKGELTSVRELIKVQVQGDNDSSLANTLEQSDFYIQTKLIKFSTYTLSMTKWAGNKKISSGQWRSQNLPDLEKSIAIAVKEITSESSSPQQLKSAPPQKTLGEQAQEKKQRASLERVEAGSQVMVGFGPAYFNKMNSSETGLGFNAGYFWNIDDHFDLGLQSEFAISTEHSDAFLLSGKIVTNYFFMAKDISPFIGAGFGYGWASVHNGSTLNLSDDTAGGFAASLHAGLKFFRTSTVNFSVSGEYTNIFDKSSLGRPGVFILKVALYY